MPASARAWLRFTLQGATMANNNYDATGVLILDRVTPVITALFRGFRLDANYPGNGQAYIARTSEVSSPSWNTVLDGLIALAAELDLPAPDRDGEDDDSEDDEPLISVVLDLLADHFGASENAELAHLIETHRFEDDADLQFLFLFATSFNGGHNLTAIQFEGSWYCSKPLLFEFGGDGCFLSREVRLFGTSSQAMRLGAQLRNAGLADAACQSGPSARRPGGAVSLRGRQGFRADHRGAGSATGSGGAVHSRWHRALGGLRHRRRRFRWPAHARVRHLLRRSGPRGNPAAELRDVRLQPVLGNQQRPYHRGNRPVSGRSGGPRHARGVPVHRFPHSVQPGDRRQADLHAVDGREPAAGRRHHRHTASAGAPDQGHAGRPGADP